MSKNFISKKAKILLLSILVLMFLFVFSVAVLKYINAHTYICVDNKVYIYGINDKQIMISGMPDKNGRFNKSYILKISKSLTIQDMSGNVTDISALKIGDILLFDYTGAKNPDPREGKVLNNRITNIRISDEIFNFKFWGIELNEK